MCIQIRTCTRVHISLGFRASRTEPSQKNVNWNRRFPFNRWTVERFMLYSGWPGSSPGEGADLSNCAWVYYFRLSVFVRVRKNYDDREISPGEGREGEGTRQMRNAGTESSSSRRLPKSEIFIPRFRISSKERNLLIRPSGISIRQASRCRG